METKIDRLSAKVRAVNTANRVALELYDRLKPIFADYVGQKVVNKDGSLVHKLAKSVEPIIESLDKSVHHIYKYSVSDYNVMYVVKTCEMCGEFTCLYHETCVYIASTRVGVMTELSKRPELRSDYNADEIADAKRRYEQAKREADAIIAPYFNFESF